MSYVAIQADPPSAAVETPPDAPVPANDRRTSADTVLSLVNNPWGRAALTAAGSYFLVQGAGGRDTVAKRAALIGGGMSLGMGILTRYLSTEMGVEL
jgi:hypothetical protein